VGEMLLPKIQEVRGDEVRIEKIVPHEAKYIGTKHMHRGHSYYKYLQGVVSVCTEEDFEYSHVRMIENTELYNVVKRINVQPGAFYRSALNMKNAVKQFKKMGLPVRLIQ
jgi:hypothetical protein